MADQKLTDKNSLSAFDDDDLIHVVDVSDTTSSAEGTSKKGLWSLFKSTLKTYFNSEYLINIVNSLSDLDALISGATDGLWLINADISLDANKTIPSGVKLVFRNTKFTGAFQLTFENTEIEAIGQCFTSEQTFAGTIANNIRPEWFGAKADDDTTDDREAVQLALEMADDLGGHTVELLKGEYYIDSRIPTKDYALEVYSNTSLIGQGMYSSTLKVGDNLVSDTPVLLTNSASNLVFRDFEINGNKQRLVSIASGEDEGIDIKGGRNINISYVYIHDMGMDAIDLDKVSTVGDTVTISNCVIEDNGGIGIHNNFYNSTVSNCIVLNNGNERKANNTGQVSDDACGIDIKGNFGIISNCYLEGNARGINLAGVANPIVSNNILYENGDENIVVGSVSSTGGTQNAIISNNTLRKTLYGIRVKKSSFDLGIYNNNVLTTGVGGIGLLVETSNRFEVIGGFYGDWYSMEIQSVDNISTISTTFTGTQAGVRVLPGASGNLVIKNCTDDISTGAGAVDLRGTVNGAVIKNNIFNSRVGVRMLNVSGNPSNIVIKDNETTGMTIIGSGHTIKRNTGYLTEASGTDTIADTNSTVVVSHGLDITPTIIGLTPAGDERIWYSGITSTQFTVNRSGTSGALDFSWEAE